MIKRGTRLLLLALALAMAVAAPATATPGDPVKCTKTYCIAVFHKTNGRISFEYGGRNITGRYRLCVTPPDSDEVCKTFHAHRRKSDGAWASSVDFLRNFPHTAEGTYRTRWVFRGHQVGPTLRWRK